MRSTRILAPATGWPSESTILPEIAGVVAGQTAIATVGKEGKGLNYRGYSIHDLAENATFEEVAFLLLHGELPQRDELDGFKKRLTAMRKLPAALLSTLRDIPADAHPMDVLRTGCSMLGCLEPETNRDQQLEKSERLLASFPSMLTYWSRYSQNGSEIDFESEQESLAGYFLEKLHGETPDDLHVRAMDVSLILYAEHEFNASTFTARVCTATLSDIYSAITAAIGTLRGHLHGGANEAAMDLIEKFDSPEQAEAGLLKMLEEKALIMGFGHRVYSVSDPRSDVIKGWAKKLGEQVGDTVLYPVSERIEEVMWRGEKALSQSRFLQRLGLPFHGDSHADVHAHLCVIPSDRMVRSRI